MLIPLTWLQDYIDLHEDVDALRELLTFSGLEVEGVETHGADLQDVVVARILAVAPHPNADKLTLCTIDNGSGETPTVVCGAPNVRVGMHTLFAPVGVTLPNGLTLKKAKIRGVESMGMLCAEDELGLSDAHDGILDLPGDPQPGTSAKDIFGGPEIVFDLEVTPNRPDCLSVIGVARELAAITGRPLRLPSVTLQEASEALHDHIQVHIADTEACPRYTARLLTGARVGPAPEWMQKRLRLCGVRPINNLVDITNYVMLETGQPLHAFDRTLLHGDTVYIRPATPGETMTTLDDRERKLAEGQLLIADQDRPLALAGVMGGADSEIRDTTTTVLLESAYFQPSLVRATAKAHQMHTESSYRFARGCDMFNTEWAGRRAAALIQEWAHATPMQGVVDLWPGERPLHRVSCRWEKITRLIGVDIPVETMQGYFQRLGLVLIDESPEGCTLEIPGFREDLQREVDLIEEIARLNGLDQIPARAPLARVIPDADDTPTRRLMKLWNRLAAMGFNEIMNYSLTAPELLQALDPAAADRREHLPNPISRDQSVLRTSLLPQMVETLSRNHARQAQEISLFELGTIFLRATESGQAVEEQTRVAFGQTGPVHRPALDKQKPVSDAEAFYGLKGQIEAILADEGVKTPTFLPLDDGLFEPGQAAEILLGKTRIGRIGLLARAHRESAKLHAPVALAEIHLDALPRRKTAVMRPVPATPATSRDTALILDRNIQHDQIMAVIRKAAPRDVEDVTLFDVFEGKKLGETRKSMAYRFTYRNPDKTLRDEAVEKMHSKIEAALMQNLQAEIVGREND